MSAAVAQFDPEAKVLVTGAAGLLGRALAARLCASGIGSRLLVRRASQARDLPSNAEIVVGDVTDDGCVARAMDGIDVVMHLAAATRGSAAEFESTNVGGTGQVVEACLRAARCRLVYVSSLGVLDHAGHNAVPGPVREDASLEPHGDLRGAYTRTKLAAEQLVRDAIRLRGLSAVILRPGQIVGPGCESVPPNGVVALRGWNLVGDGNRNLPLVYVEDVVDALLLAASGGGIEGRIFHIVDPTPVTQNEFLAAWRRRCPDMTLRRIPEPLALAAAAAVECTVGRIRGSVPLTRYRVRSLRPLSPVDISLATRVLGWTPRVGIIRGLDLCFGEREVGA